MNGLRVWGMLAGVSGAGAVMMASWASHGLPASVPPEALDLARLRAHSATQQHLIHSLALLGVALWHRVQPSIWLNIAGLLFSAGIVLFSIGIYALHLWCGWLALAVTALIASRQGNRTTWE